MNTNSILAENPSKEDILAAKLASNSSVMNAMAIVAVRRGDIEPLDYCEVIDVTKPKTTTSLILKFTLAASTCVGNDLKVYFYRETARTVHAIIT